MYLFHRRSVSVSDTSLLSRDSTTANDPKTDVKGRQTQDLQSDTDWDLRHPMACHLHTMTESGKTFVSDWMLMHSKEMLHSSLHDAKQQQQINMAAAHVLWHFCNCATVLKLIVNINVTFFFLECSCLHSIELTPKRAVLILLVDAISGRSFKVVNKCEASPWSSHIPLTPFFSHHFTSSSPLSISSISLEVNIEGNKLWSSANLQAGRKMREREAERRKDSKTCRQTEGGKKRRWRRDSSPNVSAQPSGEFYANFFKSQKVECGLETLPSGWG